MTRSNKVQSRKAPGTDPKSIAGTALALIQGGKEAPPLTKLDNMLQVDMLNRAIDGVSAAEMSWSSWAEAAIKGGASSALLPDLQEKTEFKTALQNAIANRLFSPDDLKVYLTEKTEAAKQDQTFRDKRKSFNNRVARMVAYARQSLIKAETPAETKLSPTGAGKGKDAAKGAQGSKLDLYGRVVRDLGKFVEAFKKKDAQTATDKLIIKSLESAIKNAKSVKPEKV
jgi:hypothetical protein